jgi:hypothetical protein
MAFWIEERKPNLEGKLPTNGEQMSLSRVGKDLYEKVGNKKLNFHNDNHLNFISSFRFCFCKFLPLPIHKFYKYWILKIFNKKNYKIGIQLSQRKLSSFVHHKTVSIIPKFEFTFNFKIFKHYTKKQWDKYPEELDASVLARLPFRLISKSRLILLFFKSYKQFNFIEK